jgi:hypothetical protein
VVLGILRRERWSTIGELFKFAASFVPVTVLLLGLAEIYFRCLTACQEKKVAR